MRGVHLLKPQGFHKREAHRSFPIQRIGQIGTLQAVTFGKRAYASFLRDCRFQQEKNVIVIQYERETADIATFEQRGDFPFECDRSLSGHNEERHLSGPNPLRLRALQPGLSDF